MNKTYLIVAQIFSILAAAILAIYLVFFMLLGSFFVNYGVSSGIGPFLSLIVILAILTTIYIVSSVRFQKAKTTPEMKSEVLIWGILLLFGPSFVGGIFAIIASSSQSTDPNYIQQNKSIEEKLKELDNLFDKGLISMDEYQSRRKRIIENI